VRQRPPRLIDWLMTFLLVGGLAVSTGSRAGAGPPKTVVRDLYYGEALFQFYKQDDFTALTHLLAARDAGRVPHHEAESELLLGGLYLSYGQHDRAQGIFERLLQGAQTASVRGRAWYYLGKLRYERGLYDEALASFAKIGSDLPEALAAELPMLVAQSHMAQGDFDGAQRVLAAWDAPESWLAYSRYNLGVALVRMNRVAEGSALLDRVGSMEAGTAEQTSLRDKANLALGYTYLQGNDAARARPVLERVRLRGPFASKALLGVGWADAINADYRAALVPWLELMDRDLMDSAVQESFLAVPYALGQLQAHGSAVERYQRALDTFDVEIGHLDEAIGHARAGTLVPALLDRDDAELGRWYWHLDALPDNSDSRYLYLLLADNSFQEGVKNYRDLSALASYLEDWRQRVDAFDDMVADRVSAYQEHLPAAVQRLDGVDMGALVARRDAAAARLSAAESSRDVVALATDEERERWRRLMAVEADPRLSEPGNADLRERQRVLKGVLTWDLDRQFRERVWREHRALQEVNQAIAATQGGLASIQAARTEQPRRFDEFAARIAALRPRITTMQAAIDRTLHRQEGALVALAVRELDAQKQRLASYRVQGRFALATIYDRAGAPPVSAANASGGPP
jgi:tetratricopeptide (TPR) repeat protein